MLPWPLTGKRFSPPFRKSRTTFRICATWPRKQVHKQEAVVAATQAVSLENDRYKAGTDSYINVITAQTIALGDQQTAVAILQRRMAAAVDLVKALGGGWDTSTLPSGDSMRSIALADPKNTQNGAQAVSK